MKTIVLPYRPSPGSRRDAVRNPGLATAAMRVSTAIDPFLIGVVSLLLLAAAAAVERLR